MGIIFSELGLLSEGSGERILLRNRETFASAINVLSRPRSAGFVWVFHVKSLPFASKRQLPRLRGAWRGDYRAPVL
jgi:hypothetical protein